MRTLAVLYQRIAHTFVQWRTVLAYGVISMRSMKGATCAKRVREVGAGMTLNLPGSPTSRVCTGIKHETPIIWHQAAVVQGIAARELENNRLLSGDGFDDGIR